MLNRHPVLDESDARVLGLRHPTGLRERRHKIRSVRQEPPRRLNAPRGTEGVGGGAKLLLSRDRRLKMLLVQLRAGLGGDASCGLETDRRSIVRVFSGVDHRQHTWTPVVMTQDGKGFGVDLDGVHIPQMLEFQRDLLGPGVAVQRDGKRLRGLGRQGHVPRHRNAQGDGSLLDRDAPGIGLL